jgi:putative acetyltransferase
MEPHTEGRPTVSSRSLSHTGDRAIEVDIRVEDPRIEDVRALLADHLAFSRGATPMEYSFALDVEQLVEPGVTFFSARRDGQLLGVAALKRLNEREAELKSMHTREAARGRGVGRALVHHLLACARESGYQRVNLETGSTTEFEPARHLYASCGFRPCEPFGAYAPSPYNTFMSIRLDTVGGAQ